MNDALLDTVHYRESSQDNGRAPMKFTFAPGSKPLDGYTIKRAIRRGGFGEVYYALSDAGKEVALKLIQQNMDIELRGVRQCLNLKHPNLVTIFDIKTDADGDSWVVMEFVSGKTLDDVLAEYPHGAPLAQANEWLSGISAGIDYLHDRGIVHRDLKPANIHIEHGIVKTGDVGLSKFISPSRRSAQTQSVGTVYYMAPEIAHGRYGREVDVYSLAVILYEMLTGRVPFDGETTGEILMKHLSSQPDLSTLPEPLRPVLSRALDKDPQRRTPTAGTLLQEFRAAARQTGEQGVGAAVGEAEIFAATGAPHKVPHGGGGRFQSPVPPPLPGSSPFPRSHSGGQNGQSLGQLWNENWPRELGRWARNTAPIVIALLIFVPHLVIWFVSASVKALFISGMFTAIAYGFYRGARATWELFAGALSDGKKLASESMQKHRQHQLEQARQAQTENGNAASDVMTVAAISPKREHRRGRQQPRHQLTSTPRSRKNIQVLRRNISLRQRLAEVCGSMAAATLCAGIITVGLQIFAGAFPEPVHAAFFGTTTLLAAWGAMLPCKVWEGRGNDPFVRRMILLAVGAVVGTGAYLLDEALLVSLPTTAFQAGPRAFFDMVGPHALRDTVGQPTLAGYVVFFGALFGLRQWWRHADSFRPKRLRVISVLLTMLLAFVIAGVWAFPNYWALLWAAAISSVVQIASVWIPSEERQQFVGGNAHVS